MATKKYRIGKEPRFGFDRVIYGPGVCEVIPPEAKATVKELGVLKMLEGAYAAGRAEERLYHPRAEGEQKPHVPEPNYFTDGETWVYEVRCRKCGTLHQYCGQERTKQTWADFHKYMICELRMETPEQEFCDPCGTMTVQDLVAYSPKPEAKG